MDAATAPAPVALVALFVVLGTTDEVTTCDHCGRTDLKGTIRLGAVDPATGEVDGEVFYGAVCGARAAGRTVKQFRDEAKAADRAAREAEQAARHAAMAADAAERAELDGTADCQRAPGMCRRSGIGCVAHS
jgi:hypothetical protein